MGRLGEEGRPQSKDRLQLGNEGRPQSKDRLENEGRPQSKDRLGNEGRSQSKDRLGNEGWPQSKDPFLLPCQPLLLASSSSPVSFHSLFLPAPYSLSSPFSPWLSLLRLLLLPTSSALPLQVL